MVECAWAVFVDDFGDVSAHPLVWVSVCGGMWWVCGTYGVVWCAALGIPRGMVVQFLSLLLFALAFWSGVGCDFWRRGAVWGGVASGASCRPSNLEGWSIIEHSSIRV